MAEVPIACLSRKDPLRHFSACELKEDTIDRLYVYLTSMCNLRCAFCASDYVHFGSEITLSFNEYVSFLDRFGERARSLTLSGGEPTCVEGLLCYISAARRKGIDVVLQTNGIRLCDRSYCDRLIASGIGTISVPFFASTAGSYCSLTGTMEQSFSKYIEGLQNLSVNALNGHVKLSLKVLGLAGYLDELRGVKPFLAEHDIIPTSICLNGLHYGKSIEDNPKLWPSLPELGQVYSAIIEDFDGELPISCVEVPLCILTDSALLALLQKESCTRAQHVVVMLNLSGESTILDDGRYKPESCLRCSLNSFCDGMNRKNSHLFIGSAIRHIIPIEIV